MAGSGAGESESYGPSLPYTTGFRIFAECLGHSAKPRKHSAKALPSVTPGKAHSAANIPAKTSLPSAFCRALGKGLVFAERQEEGARQSLGHFAECRPRGTRQSSGNFAECFIYTLGKLFFLRF
jgi:hypothetical protein